MTYANTAQSVRSAGANACGDLRALLDSLNHLPTSAAVMVKLLALGHDPDASAEDYAAIIEADPGLAARLLRLANSPWCAVRREVTSIKAAVSLLGQTAARTVSMSYCLSGLHHALRLPPDLERSLWEAALLKAATARRVAERCGASTVADEAFLCGLFQDIAIPVMCAARPVDAVDLVCDAQLPIESRLSRESVLFGMDHCEAGRTLAQKLELPDAFVDAVAFHHSPEDLTRYLPNGNLALCVSLAGMLPHGTGAWPSEQIDRICDFLAIHAGRTPYATATELLADVRESYGETHRMLRDGREPSLDVAALAAGAAERLAANSEELVRGLVQLSQRADSMEVQLAQLRCDRQQLETLVVHDSLTGVLNRKGVFDAAGNRLAQARRYGVGVAVAYIDVDRFKQTNDAYGHAFGDAVLSWVASVLRDGVRRQDVVGRVGGDEFVTLLYDCTRAEARQIMSRVLNCVGAEPVRHDDVTATVTVSIGVVWVDPNHAAPPFGALVKRADRAMYDAKHDGRNKFSECEWQV